jgi:hypothetical protein
VQPPALGDDARDWGGEAGEEGDRRIVLDSPVRAPGAREGDELRVLQLRGVEALEELQVLGVRGREARLHVVETQSVELARYAGLVLGGEAYPLPLGPVP